MSKTETRFKAAFEPAERQLRAILGGSVTTQQFYSAVAILHSLASEAARRS
jgi:hypothetical protein